MMTSATRSVWLARLRSGGIGRFLREASARLAVWALLFSLTCTAVFSQQGKPSEYALKAAYLYNFGKFVEWPAPPEKEFPICILGQNPFGSALDGIVRGETIGGQPLVTRPIERGQTVNGCRVLFIGASEENRLSMILDSIAAAPVLTVSDIPNFVTRGGMIGFVMADNKIRFEVNLSAAQSAGLMFSSQLLKVAVSIKGGPDSGK
jgi:hypothetical protein